MHESAEDDLPAEPDARLRRAAMIIAAFAVLGVIAAAILVYVGVGAPPDSGGAFIAYGAYVAIPAVVGLVLMVGLLRGWGWARVAGIGFAGLGAAATGFATLTLQGDVAFPFAPFLLWLPADRNAARLFLAVACVAWALAAYFLLAATLDAGRVEPTDHGGVPTR